MGDIERFTEFLFGDSTGYVHAPVKLKNAEFVPAFFHWPSDKQRLHDYLRSSVSDGDVYISPALYTEKRATKEYVKSTRTVWVEFDGKEHIDFKGLPAPDVIVQTSTATHQHCYWSIPEITAESAEDINLRATYYLEADTSGWDITQVLRVPETKNWKSQLKPLDVIVVHYDIKGTESKAFDRAPAVERPEYILSYDDILDIDKLKLSEGLYGRVMTQQAKENGRSHLLFSIAHDMAENGHSHQEILSALYHVDSRIKKFVGRQDQLHRLAQIAAIAVYKSTDQIESYSPLDIVNHEITLDFLIDGLLHANGMAFLSGAPGVGKTQLSLFLAYLLSTGGSVFSKPVHEPVSIAFYSLEMDVAELKYIFEHQRQDYPELELWNQNVKVYTFDEPKWGIFEKIIRDTRPDVCIIDSLSELASEDLQIGEARKIMAWFKMMRRKYNVCFVLIAHNTKSDGKNKVTLSSMYGSQFFAAKSETVMILDDHEGSAGLDLHVKKARFGRTGVTKIHRTPFLTFIETRGQESVEMIEDAGEKKINPMLPENFETGSEQGKFEDL
jgi:archaellum biogenesis ATPase FlaH